MECLSEETIVGFVDGRLAAEELAAVESHARACAACQTLLSAGLAVASGGGVGKSTPAHAPPESGPGAVPRGTSIGRYTVLDLVGEGGMGQVYAAYDPKLDRKIALKLLRARAGGSVASGESRLVREAQAIARLSHANVITVHDVGSFGDRVFVAMEYVEGQTLAAWSAERPRTRHEILAVFRDAARGLEAAHAAGIVHRDFKPQNVMVGADGTVRVMDFGLARRIDGDGGGAGARAEPLPPDNAEPAGGTMTLTRTGELIGTPLYMAPEQFKGNPTDARTDQFSYCVALYQALHGEHPFLGPDATGGARMVSLLEAVLEGRIRPAPARSAVPAWLRRVLARGLSVDPAARWPSMSALSAALARDPARRRRRIAAAAVAALAAAALAVGLARAPRAPQRLCAGGLARLGDTWPAPGTAAADSRRTALRRAFGATGVPDAARTWSRTVMLLDRYAVAWLNAYREACEATQVRGEQSAEVLDLRMACLDERRGTLAALTDLLGRADREAVTNAIDAVTALPALDRCNDVKLLRAAVEPPPDAETRRRVDDLRRRANTIKALNDTGHLQEALEQGHALIVEARALGYLPLTAEVLDIVGGFQHSGAYRKEALPLLREAVMTALRAKRDDIAAEAAALLAGHEIYVQQRLEDGERWTDIGEALVDRMGGGHDRIRAWLAAARADALLVSNQLEPALRKTREALALKRKVLPPDHPDIALSMQTEAEILHRLGNDRAALEIADQAYHVLEDSYGPASPHVAGIQNNRGEYLVALGRPAEAVPLFRDALARWEAYLAGNMYMAYPLTGLGRAYLALGRPAEAIAPLERALRIRERLDPELFGRAETRLALADALWLTGDPARARASAKAARDDYQRSTNHQADVARATAWLDAHH